VTRWRPRSLEGRAAGLALLGGLPAVVAAAALASAHGLSVKALVTLGLVVVGAWLACALAVRGAVLRALQTLGNLVGSLREGDYGLRGRQARRGDAYGEAVLEVNALGDALRAGRVAEVEAEALVARLTEVVDVAVLAFDAEGALRLANGVAEALLGAPRARLLGRSAAELEVGELLRGEAPRVLDRPFPGRAGRFELRRAPVRRMGAPHELVVLSDVSRALREEEQLAWRRLVRVLSHEINNSLAPVRSIAQGLLDLVASRPLGPEHRDVGEGLEVIARRADALSRFMEGYARLARLPRPTLAAVEVGSLVRRAAALERRVRVEVVDGPALTVEADADQVEQALINLLRNGADAALVTGGGVRVGWAREGDGAALRVHDEGPGLPEAANLFVPFFTTKPGGSGVGLTLSRQIAEAHGGRLTLRDAEGGGCVAELWLPARRGAASRAPS
jgi:signal transduction histidine kinase